jgi:HK97 family phage prohead protease
MKAVTERRLVSSQLELRKNADGNPVLEGYAAVFGSRSEDLGGFVEQIAPSAFTKTLKDGADVRALLNHDPNFVLGRSTSGTLRMSTDTTGLHYEVDLGSQSYARDLAISLERGDISQSSFGFRMVTDDWAADPEDEGRALRTLLEVKLFDVSPVTYPAYPDATSGLRALEAAAERRGLDAATVDALLPKPSPIHVRKYSSVRDLRNRLILAGR